jgi:hypothetical protein
MGASSVDLPPLHPVAAQRGVFKENDWFRNRRVWRFADDLKTGKITPKNLKKLKVA